MNGPETLETTAKTAARGIGNRPLQLLLVQGVSLTIDREWLISMEMGWAVSNGAVVWIQG